MSVRLLESVKTAMLAATPSRRGSSTNGRNWIENDKPGGQGKLPNYIEQVRDGVMKSGKPEHEAYAIAVGKIRRWAAGGDGVSPEVQAASAEALAEWEAMKARAHAKRDHMHEAFAEQLHPRGPGGEWTVKNGATGGTVKSIQRRVGAKADGQYGSLTERAVRAFQRKHGLQVDGIVGRQTMAALQGRKDAAKVRPGALTGADRKAFGADRSLQEAVAGALLEAPYNIPNAFGHGSDYGRSGRFEGRFHPGYGVASTRRKRKMPAAVRAMLDAKAADGSGPSTAAKSSTSASRAVRKGAVTGVERMGRPSRLPGAVPSTQSEVAAAEQKADRARAAAKAAIERGAPGVAEDRRASAADAELASARARLPKDPERTPRAPRPGSMRAKREEAQKVVADLPMGTSTDVMGHQVSRTDTGFYRVNGVPLNTTRDVVDAVIGAEPIDSGDKKRFASIERARAAKAGGSSAAAGLASLPEGESVVRTDGMQRTTVKRVRSGYQLEDSNRKLTNVYTPEAAEYLSLHPSNRLKRPIGEKAAALAGALRSTADREEAARLVKDVEDRLKAGDDPAPALTALSTFGLKNRNATVSGITRDIAMGPGIEDALSKMRDAAAKDLGEPLGYDKTTELMRSIGPGKRVRLTNRFGQSVTGVVGISEKHGEVTLDGRGGGSMLHDAVKVERMQGNRYVPVTGSAQQRPNVMGRDKPLLPIGYGLIGSKKDGYRVTAPSGEDLGQHPSAQAAYTAARAHLDAKLASRAPSTSAAPQRRTLVGNLEPNQKYRIAGPDGGTTGTVTKAGGKWTITKENGQPRVVASEMGAAQRVVDSLGMIDTAPGKRETDADRVRALKPGQQVKINQGLITANADGSYAVAVGGGAFGGGQVETMRGPNAVDDAVARANGYKVGRQEPAAPPAAYDGKPAKVGDTFTSREGVTFTIKGFTQEGLPIADIPSQGKKDATIPRHMVTAGRRVKATPSAPPQRENTSLSTLRPDQDKIDDGVWFWRHADGKTISVGDPNGEGAHAKDVRDFTGPDAERRAEEYAGKLRAGVAGGASAAPTSAAVAMPQGFPSGFSATRAGDGKIKVTNADGTELGLYDTPHAALLAARDDAGLTSTRDRRAAKADRLEQGAARRQASADAASAYDAAVSQTFPRGVGGSGRRAGPQEKLIDRAARAFQDQQAADRMQSSADGIRRAARGAIYTNDENAPDALRARIDERTARLEQMKAANAEFRKANRERLKGMTAYEKDQALPYPSWKTKNLSADVRRQKDRLRKLTGEDYTAATAPAQPAAAPAPSPTPASPEAPSSPGVFDAPKIARKGKTAKVAKGEVTKTTERRVLGAATKIESQDDPSLEIQYGIEEINDAVRNRDDEAWNAGIRRIEAALADSEPSPRWPDDVENWVELQNRVDAMLEEQRRLLAPSQRVVKGQFLMFEARATQAVADALRLTT